jgi:hypothetical protein
MRRKSAAPARSADARAPEACLGAEVVAPIVAGAAPRRDSAGTVVRPPACPQHEAEPHDPRAAYGRLLLGGCMASAGDSSTYGSSIVVSDYYVLTAIALLNGKVGPANAPRSNGLYPVTAGRASVPTRPVRRSLPTSSRSRRSRHRLNSRFTRPSAS